MSTSNQHAVQRTLARKGARTLTVEEIAQILGGQNHTFAFTHVINPDIVHD